MTDLPDSFADHPVSLAEVRAERSQDGKDWTPRDALIELLREIDAGERVPDNLIIVCSTPTEDGEHSVWWSSACKDAMRGVGLLARALYRINAVIDNNA